MIARHDSRRPHLATRNWCNRPLRWLGFALGIALPPAVALGGPLQEDQAFTSQVLNPQFGTSMSVPLDIPRFDSQGGTRALTAVDISYSFLLDLRFESYGNPADYPVANYLEFTVGWTASDAGNPILPDHVVLAHTPYAGWEAEPGDAPRTSYINGFGIGDSETITDGLALAMLTGPSPLAVDSLFDVSFAVDLPPWDSYYTWDTDFFDLYIDRLYVDATMTFHYALVPEPGSLVAFGALSLLTLRRRVRRGAAAEQREPQPVGPKCP